MGKRRFRSFTLVAALAAGFLTAGRVSASPVLLNGSFEDPALAANSFEAGGGTSWMATGTDFIVSNDYASPTLGPLGNTPYGADYLDLDLTGSTDSQSVAGFVAGQTYFVGADFADLDGAAAPSFTLSVSGAAVASSTFTAPVGGPYGTGTIPYTSAVILFTPLTSGSVTITLTNNSGPSGNGYSPALAVDNVSLYGFAPVPEPTTTVAALLGAGALAGAMIRRRLRLA